MIRYIINGKKIRIYSDYWGYSFESLKSIHTRAKELGVCENANFRLYDYSQKKEILYNEMNDNGGK